MCGIFPSAFTSYLETCPEFSQTPQLQHSLAHIERISCTYINNHLLANKPLNTIPGPPVYEAILPQLSRRFERLEGEHRHHVIPKRVRVRPRRLTDGGPDERFLDIGRRLVKAGQKADGVVAGDGGAEELREEGFN